MCCPAGVCMAGIGGLLKLSQLVVAGSLASTGSGTGGYVFERISAGDLMTIFDNLYRKCYNKCNDDNKKAICHQTVKFAL